MQADRVRENPLQVEGASSGSQTPSNSPKTTRWSSRSSARSCSSERSTPTQYSQLAEDPHQCPYNLGFTTFAQRHEPPNPFDPGFTGNYSPEKLADLRTMSHTDFCMSYQPISGRTVSDQTTTLSITSIIRTGPRTGAQLVVVNNSTVAKIYDPLYYDPSDGPDVVMKADQAYSHEAAAYAHLQNSPEVSNLVPNFHGSWTINVSTAIHTDGRTESRSREVRLILIEHLDGICMLKKDPRTLSEHARSVILAQCIDAEVRLLNTGLDHMDFVPRNIILQGCDYQTPSIKVKILDFEWCHLYKHPNYPDQKFAQKCIESNKKWAPMLVNPVKRWRNLEVYAHLGWCSENEDEWLSWLWDVFGNDDRYRPVHWDPNTPEIAPQYVNKNGETDDNVF